MNSREADPADPFAGRQVGAWGFETASDLLDEARTSVSWVPPAVLRTPLRRDVASTASRLAQLAGRGVRVHVLCPDAVGDQPDYLGLLGIHRGTLAMRLARHGWPEHVLVDDAAALLRTRTRPSAASGAGSSPDAAVVVRAQPVVTTLAAAFRAEWEASAPLPAPVPADSRLATEPARRILDLLAAGYRDAAAASELGLSIRTYRRHVAELMGELRAVSRFQAGVQAAHRGLLPRG